MSTTTRVTYAQYEEMIRQGVFEPREEHHVELIYGEIVPMSPIGNPHCSVVDRLNDWSVRSLPEGVAWVRCQGSLGIPELESVPEPDFSWLRHDDYFDKTPGPADVFLVVEVADSSLAKDRGLKARLYAEAGLSDYWIVNVPARCIEVRRDPRDGAYQSVVTYRAGQLVRPLAFPDVALPVASLFPA